MAKKADGKRPIIIRKEEVIEGGHHGGAWKVAYADFVTAMMAFFLLMWLLNATTEAQRRGLADYFTPNNLLSHTNSGTGQPFGGRTPYDAGSMVSDRGAMTIAPGKSSATVAPDDAEDPTSSMEIQPRLIDDTDGDPASAQVATRGDTTAENSGGVGRVAAEGHADGPQTTITRATASARAAAPNAAAQDKAAQDKAAQDHVRGDTAAQSERAQRLERNNASLHPASQEQPAQSKADQETAVKDKAAQDKTARQAAEQAAFQQAAQQIRTAVRSDPTLSAMANQIAVDMTPAGLRIQLMDEDNAPMFATGSASLNERASRMLQKIAPILGGLPQPIAISGHTDAAPYHGANRSNWELSSERANATRRLLVEAGLPEGRIRSVSGDADRDLLLPADPLAAANRRIAIVALRDGAPAQP